MRIAPEIDQASLVLRGRFNPAIFQPFWFAANRVIGQDEAAAAEIEIIHPEVCKFQTDNYVIQVERERFMVTSRSGPLELIKDLVIKTFGDYLPHTPAGALGINRMVHFDAGSFEIRDGVGRKLAPWEPWGEWAKSLKGHDRQTHGGMTSLQMRQNVAPAGYSGYIQAIVQPSNVIPDYKGIYVQINNHYQVLLQEDAMGATQVVAALEDQWQPAMTHAAFIVDQIMKQAEEIKNALAASKPELAWRPPDGQLDSRTDDMSEINPQPYVAPGSLTADTAAPFDKKQRDTLPSMERPPSVLPLPRLRPPLASQDERRQVVQDFGGIVEDVDWKSGSFNARLIDLTAGDHIAYIMAEFPIDDIRSDDKDLVTEGAVFRVRVMYLIKPGGTRRRFTEIIFRRLPSWRGRNFEIAEQLASDLSAYFENST